MRGLNQSAAIQGVRGKKVQGTSEQTGMHAALISAPVMVPWPWVDFWFYRAQLQEVQIMSWPFDPKPKA